MLEPVKPKLVRRESNGATFEGASFSPLLKRVLSARGVSSAEALDFNLKRLLPYDRMPGITAAVEILEEAFLNDRRVVIIGDYDADGATSTALLMKAFKAFGFEQVDYMVPNRFRFGYGLTPEIVEAAVKAKQPDLIITVDNGIASVEGVEVAKNHGVDVIVTDHHLPGEVLPAAAAIVNPNSKGSDFPSRMLAGVGVAFYVATALRRRLAEGGHFEFGNLPRLDSLLDLVAVGTVADVVPLDDNNRILVEQGLRRIRSGKCSAGIKALLSVSRRPLRKISTSDLGFAVAPRINAAGRLEDISTGIECLLAEKMGKAMKLATSLDVINQRRRKVEKDMEAQALSSIEQVLIDEEEVPNGICLFDEAWHEGVIGLLASRLKDRFHRPCAVFTRTASGGIKGSVRSVPGVHVRDLLERISIRESDLILHFGGHAMAAGLIVADDGFDRFKTAFEEEAAKLMDNDVLECRLFSDGMLAPADFSFENAVELRTAAPWGVSFPEPVFDGVFDVENSRVIAERHLQMTLRPEGEDVQLRGILYNMQKYPVNEGMSKIRIAYLLAADEYNGRRAPLLNIRYLEVIE